ncbi:MAG: acyl-CoA/acyl-ACP dehydrogenase [Polyangiaceae bacterium]|nr:acyl-CoA/acyl-ACP dehydrogenase [Polyangiaceae bacterium]
MSQEDLHARVDQIASDVVAKHAGAVDEQSAFPEASIAALRDAGLLGLVSATAVGGQGKGLRDAALVVERLARECGSTAMVVCMHYAATTVLENLGSESVRRDIAAGKHLTTLAFSEAGSRSQFWAPLGTATEQGGKIALNARKSWVTSANRADSYVWSSKPVAGAEASTLWFVPRTTPGLRVDSGFNGLGLRGNDSCPVTAEDVRIDPAWRLGTDGQGFSLMLEMVLPWFNVMNAACSVGLMEAATSRTAAHVSKTAFEHSSSSIAELPTVRAYIARMRIKTDMSRALLLDTFAAIETQRADAVLRVLESKAAAGDTAGEVLDLAMRVCGGAAFRKELAVERIFRDARAALVMAPTTDVLYDFIGKACCDMPLF